MIGTSGRARLTLVDALGRRVRLLSEDDRGAGSYSLTFDGSDLASGLYFLILETPTERLVERLTIRN